MTDEEQEEVEVIPGNTPAPQQVALRNEQGEELTTEEQLKRYPSTKTKHPTMNNAEKRQFLDRYDFKAQIKRILLNQTDNTIGLLWYADEREQVEEKLVERCGVSKASVHSDLIKAENEIIADNLEDIRNLLMNEHITVDEAFERMMFPSRLIPEYKRLAQENQLMITKEENIVSFDNMLAKLFRNLELLETLDMTDRPSFVSARKEIRETLKTIKEFGMDLGYILSPQDKLDKDTIQKIMTELKWLVNIKQNTNCLCPNCIPKLSEAIFKIQSETITDEKINITNVRRK